MSSIIESPALLNHQSSLSDLAVENVKMSRQTIRNIIDRIDPRPLVIVGPCSFHDPEANLEYAFKLKRLADKFVDRLYIVMRVYPEKPRTCLGWKGYLCDPNLDDSCDMLQGLIKTREFMSKLCEIDLPIATEILNPIAYLYYEHMLSWATIGARTVESQVHREIASDLAMPVGFKNNIFGDINVAMNSIRFSANGHTYLGVDRHGRTSITTSKGNSYAHLVLRGGNNGPNYQKQHIEPIVKSLVEADLPSGIIVDCSHANSSKDYSKQPEIFHDVLLQKIQGNDAIVGLMLESFLVQGNQPISTTQPLKYGCSITDGCLSWEATETLLSKAYQDLAVLQLLESLTIN